jgi:hypothetical protein
MKDCNVLYLSSASQSDTMPCENPDHEIDQHTMPDPKLWTKRGRVYSHQDHEDGEEEDMDDDRIDEKRCK